MWSASRRYLSFDDCALAGTAISISTIKNFHRFIRTSPLETIYIFGPNQIRIAPFSGFQIHLPSAGGATPISPARERRVRSRRLWDNCQPRSVPSVESRSEQHLSQQFRE